MGISSGLVLALASSVIPMLLPLTCLTVGPPGREAGQAGNVSMFCNVHGMVRVRSIHRQRVVRGGPPSRTHTRPITFWFKPVSLFGLLQLTMLTSVHWFNPCHPILAPHRIETSGWATLSRGLQTPAAARRAPASVEYLWRNTGLNPERSVLRSEQPDFTSHKMSKVLEAIRAVSNSRNVSQALMIRCPRKFRFDWV